MFTTTDEQIIDAIAFSNSMREAASKTNLHYNTFSRRAKQLGIYKPNQGGKGKSKPKADGNGKIQLAEILDGSHPSYQTFKLKRRLYKSGIKQNKCEICSLESWLSAPIECELDHIDGNSYNHKLENLRILCPNCHSQTTTFRAKKRLVPDTGIEPVSRSAAF